MLKKTTDKCVCLGRVMVLLGALAGGPLRAGSLNVSNSLLDNSDRPVLVAPAVDFSTELARMSLEPSEFHAVIGGDTFDGEASASELADLAASLKKAGLAAPEADLICAAHRVEMEKLAAYLSAAEHPGFPKFIPAIGLPDEFADYFEGVVAWADPAQTNKAPAREAWREVLSLPAPERRFKSTWAVFMLGKSLQNEDPARAVAWFKRVRDLSAHGFADSIGLASASLGLEAQIESQQGQIAEAVELDLEQLATGDKNVCASLRMVASTALNKGDANALSALAANPKVRRVITADLISHDHQADAPDRGDAARKWLAALEASDSNDVSAQDEFALAAYQASDWTAAQKWIDRAGATPVSQWLQAKLLLRAGKVDQAAALLDRVAALFQLQPQAANSPGQLKDDLFVYDFNNRPGGFSNTIPAAEQVLGELGVLRLARREYAGALDALMRSGFRDDADYVADRVLTVDELKDYVDRNWPGGTDDGIRDLLARRLARLGRPSEARAYYSASLLSKADALAKALRAGADLSSPAADRARSLFAAAQMTETNGMDLLATETEPDWHDQGGEYQTGVTVAGRANDATNMLHASEDELRRVGASAPDPDVRYHYRFQAADLAWQAALLLPDNSDETARVLCDAGTWIKYLNPRKADVFYKALVRRCRKTAIGAQADRMRWFPALDGAGNPVLDGTPDVK